MSDVTEKCPIYAYIEVKFAEDVSFLENYHGMPQWEAICTTICPEVLGHYEALADGRCAVRARMLRIQ
ncbi:hypothetical protein GJ688_12285 [Heliobacillus mobilis]|uniref:Uncharacterized protein n=2 Tax=Heliobacterium TaxID=2697 RepID=A0A6I3SLD4_HELMO|nr:MULTISPECIES: hypothetical protein [Heliobacterium]MBC9785620.1 hypothetical protein [Heliobacterium chlorum]MTV49751.1 hypothetical protein [Heliobacterium mobile]